ncbi:FAD/NAD(P)-binding domain-containing protein [Parathielavia appendiculata]|uniref:FAD/NAD(P)-binding domain-containing protein n=1 Tax=Parathielavia appendiculata TaxID=2587402 RepID=A0AAN6TRU4_9PEZI|nr:FAD/NAD(P)-binding domain-containing protein [Parathielavia appendiculata]
MPLSMIIIVGAGPSGLLLALPLARANICHPPRANSIPRHRTRASHHTTESCIEFGRAGILDDVRAEGFTPDGVSWRRLDEKKTRMEGEGRYKIVLLPLHRLDKILESRVLEQSSAEIKYGCKVVELGEEGRRGKAWVRAGKEGGGSELVEGEYVVGCDEANSTVRRRLFGEMVFPGFTWNEQIVATNVDCNFGPYDCDDSLFFVHSEHWHMVARIQTDGFCRVTYGDVGGFTYEQLKERQPGRFQAFLPGNPNAGQSAGFLLAADAAHLCNPFGGMGFTGGIADVGSLYDSLVGIHTGQADDSILDKYGGV